ncbi:hypothetical protein B0H14DRAFT_3436677 [Mycena olivaceomarginata]|nr:hypothetical protein B0H14DRAFT_3436677 [Mycena olivaceomarginata]
MSSVSFIVGLLYVSLVRISGLVDIFVPSAQILLCLHCDVPDLHLIICVKTARLSLRTPLSSKKDAAPVLAFVRATGRLPRYIV